MKKYFTSFFILFALLYLPLLGQAQQHSTSSPKIPVDPNVKTGTFKNGVSYYIRHNKKPKHEVDLRLIIKAGSILENKNQQGLAHVMEHMNFNGTKHFKKNELVDYLQKIGVKFGADLNANTAFNRTMYILPLPTQDTAAVNKGFQILEDWAHEARLKPDMIDDERGVVLEEYRIGLGAQNRMQKQYLPIILNHSCYTRRLPIGTKKSIEHFKYKNLRNFYHDWYRPDLTGVVAVGDLSVDEMFKKVKAHFAHIKNPKSEPKRKPYATIPNHKKTLIAVASDSEAASSRVQLIYQDEMKSAPSQTLQQFREGVEKDLFISMVNSRLSQRANATNPPFISASSSHQRLIAPETKAYTIVASTSSEDRIRALKAMLITNKKIKKYGFKDTELSRAKKQLLSSYKYLYNSRRTLRSGYYVSSYVQNFLFGTPIPSITWQYQEAKKIIPDVTMQDITPLKRHFIHQDNRSVVVTGPPQNASKSAQKQAVRNAFAEVKKQDVTPYQDEGVRKHLMEKKPAKGTISQAIKNDTLGTTTLTLSNGAKVEYKKTDFEDNQILFRAFSYGGSSLYSNKTLEKTHLANQGLTQAGIAGLSKTALQKVLAGKNVRVSPYINDDSEGMSGYSTMDDFETLFQLIHLYFTSLNKDPQAFQTYMQKAKARYAHLNSNPNYYFLSKLQNFVYKKDPRKFGLPTSKMLNEQDYNLAYKKYTQRFSNAADFKFYFVGSIPVKKLKKYAEIYLASLPSSPKREQYKTYSYRPLSGSHKKIIHKGKEPKSMVEMLYTGETSFSLQKKYCLKSLADILEIKMLQNMREKESGVYTVQATSRLNKTPFGLYVFNISFPCSPDNVKMLEKSALKEVQKIVRDGPSREDLNKVKKNQLLSYKKQMRRNSYWLSKLYQTDFNQTSDSAILHFKQQVKNLSREDIQQTARKFLTKGHITGVLYPGKKTVAQK